MRSPRLLVIDGNTAEARARQVAAGGRRMADAYADLLRSIRADAAVDICRPTDEAADLPDAAKLGDYDGVAMTGSALNIYDRGPAIGRQIDLVRSVFASGSPYFGSCWGLQIATVAAGGTVRRHPDGREIGIARPIRRTGAGASHPLLAGKPDPYTAITVHLDEVERPAPGTTVLAENDWSAVQAAEIRCGPGVAWAVQYHPEYSFTDIAVTMRRYAPALVQQRLFTNEADAARHAGELKELDDRPDDPVLAARHGADQTVLDPAVRTLELKNWLDWLVLPTMSQRGR
ncbi:MAG: type 1 glutamine amidotransferase [Chromatiales bacterium]